MTSGQLQEIKDHITGCFNGTAQKKIIERIKKLAFERESLMLNNKYILLGLVETGMLKAEIDALSLLRDGTLTGLDGSRFMGFEVIECRRTNMLEVR